MAALTSSSFTTSNADGGTVTWAGTQATITNPSTSKSVFAKCNTTYNSQIIYLQSNLNVGTNTSSGNLGGLYLSSTDFVTSSQLHTQNYHALIGGRNNTASKYRIRVNDTANIYNLDDGTLPDQIKDVKITFNVSTNDIKFWYWNGSSWSQMGTTQTVDIRQGGSLKAYLTNVNVGDTNTYVFDNTYFGSAAADYTTQYPASGAVSSGMFSFFLA